ncbi:MAG: hypothetical protein R3Y47_01150 [Lachnospiraceae bacterium]
MQEFWNTINTFITTDNIALLSVIITILIFIFSRHVEMQYKKHDDRKVQYLKLITLLKEYITTTNTTSTKSTSSSQNSDIQISNKQKEDFFDVGASLLLYGSKNLYRQYLFFREFTNNPLIKQCNYYDSALILYIMSNILTTIRKEVGLNLFNNIQDNEALGFFVNDIVNNPVGNTKSIQSKFKIQMIKFELFIINCSNFIHFKKLWYMIVMPIFGMLNILIKYLIIVPIIKTIFKFFPIAYGKLTHCFKSKK